jgi:hypothetical protein
MDFQFWPAVVAGFAGGAVMTVVMTMMRKSGKTEMDMALIEGTMFTGDRDKAKTLGTMMHLIVMSALVIGSVYAALFALFDVDSSNAWWIGALFGVAHGLLAGVMMGMMPKMHPRMADSAEASDRGRHEDSDGSLLLKPPGVFAKNYGKATPVGVVMVHVIYGLVTGLVYGLLV